ncbi:LANO_0H10198g1_1 [Lachancea nothofagi CBS 11611]|uniref:LANO_0H10198g1_1 n=1 Tax=Lachancea nothofagi CBS 11611 TaxID=1266666 RepID=A0A1G4KM52_9SACH|nr:LANO_0H10198g1_1 [Lachancea nothofagi CBS 11611]
MLLRNLTTPTQLRSFERSFCTSMKVFQNHQNFNILPSRLVKGPKTSSNPAKNLRRSTIPKIENSTSRCGNYSQSGDAFKIDECTTITTSEAYDLEKVKCLLIGSGYHPASLVPDEIISFKYLYNGCMSDVMILGNCGTVVSWGLGESFVTENILSLIQDARVNALADNEIESEDLDFIEIESKEDLEKVKRLTTKSGDESFIDGDMIFVNSIDPNLGLLDKAALSSGMSRSTRLAILEDLLKTHIEKSKKFTELLSKGKKLNLTESEVLKSTGSLFLIRGKLNLYSELIETPDLYWSEPRLERIYKQMSKNLDIQPRISILNTKLDFAAEESRAFMAVLNEKKSTHLEWIIIYLITIEVCFELHHYYERYWIDRPDKIEQTEA